MKQVIPSRWPQPVAAIAVLLQVSPARVRQLLGEMEILPVDRIGNVPLYSFAQFRRLRQRDTKPGPKPINGKRGTR